MDSSTIKSRISTKDTEIRNIKRQIENAEKDVNNQLRKIKNYEYNNKHSSSEITIKNNSRSIDNCYKEIDRIQLKIKEYNNKLKRAMDDQAKLYKEYENALADESRAAQKKFDEEQKRRSRESEEQRRRLEQEKARAEQDAKRRESEAQYRQQQLEKEYARKEEALKKEQARKESQYKKSPATAEIVYASSEPSYSVNKKEKGGFRSFILKFLVLIMALVIASVIFPLNKDKSNSKPVTNHKPSVENAVKDPTSSKSDNTGENKEEQLIKTEDSTVKEPEKVGEPVIGQETEDSEWLKSRKDLLDFPDWDNESIMDMFTITLAYEDILFSATNKHSNIDWMSKHGNEIMSNWVSFWSWLCNDYADYLDGMESEYSALWVNCTSTCKSFMTGKMNDSDAAQIAEAINAFYPYVGQPIANFIQ